MGKPGVAFLLAHGWHSVSDWIVRSHTVYAHLGLIHGTVQKGRLYIQSDAHYEKCGISYFLGMLSAKILSARLLDVPWLFHVSMIGAIGGSITLKGKSEPDLIGGCGVMDWVVAEAKGRSFGYSSSAMTAAKLQTQQVRQINGSYPGLRVAVQAFFRPDLQWAIEDPDEIDTEAPDMAFDVSKALDSYYSAPIATLTRGRIRKLAGNFIARTIPEVGITVVPRYNSAPHSSTVR